MIESTKQKMLIAIDGCPVGCAKKTWNMQVSNVDEYVQVTEWVLRKHEFSLAPSMSGK